MTDYFDLEQEIMRCWEITSDLHVVSKHINDGSDYTELMIGMAQLYDMKFQKMFDMFEKMVEAYKNSDYVFVCKHCGDELGIKWSEDTIGQVTINPKEEDADNN